MLKYKKSQLYLLAGIILVLSLFLIISSSNLIIKKDFDNSILDNYYYEGLIIFDNALLHNLNITDSLINYTNNFFDYLKKKNTKINLLIIYSYQNYYNNDLDTFRDKLSNKIVLINYLNDTILIRSKTTKKLDNIQKNQILEINKTDLEIEYMGNKYELSFKYYIPEFKVLFIKDELISFYE